MCLYVCRHLWQPYKYRKYYLTQELLLVTNFRQIFLKINIDRKILYKNIGAMYLYITPSSTKLK